MFTLRKVATLLTLAIAWCAFANSATAQQPIVRVKVMPTNPAFGGWSKPAVLKSAEDAAKYFDKDALAALNKSVDFKKQIVLIFAWKGSGGDKLDYTVAESFPEQITFSRTPGLTRDLREHVHVFALRSNVKWSVKGAPPIKRLPPEKQDADKPGGVRLLKFKASATLTFNGGGKASATLLADKEAVEKLVGRRPAESLLRQVDFAKEAIVFVSWNTSGPPDGKLMHETKGQKLTFYVQGPPGGGARGQRLRLGADFFAVPRDFAVSFDPKER